MRRTFATVLLSGSLAVGAILPAAAATEPPIPLPSSMAAVGDSITKAASTGGTLGADYPANSWATGTNSTVNSHYLRLLAEGATMGNAVFNESVSGAKVGNLVGQMQAAAAHQPDYLTVLIGGNDLCTDTVGEMTDPMVFEDQFEDAMAALRLASPDTHVYVVSIPDVYQLWSLFKNNWWARIVWSSADICQSLLANPTSTQTSDVNRRQLVRTTNIAYNAALAAVCEADAAISGRCHHDHGAVFGTTLTRSDVSGDYFHPSLAGQAKLASVSWDVGYSWGVSPPPPPENQAPTAVIAVPSQCTAGVACAGFDASGSTDPDVDDTLTYHWNFGDGTTGDGVTALHTYASTAGSPYIVTLTVSDGTTTAVASESVTVTAPSTVITLTVSASKVRGVQQADLTWVGATSTNVDVYRNGARITTIANDGTHTDIIGGRGGGTYTYKVCEAGTSTCSQDVIVSY